MIKASIVGVSCNWARHVYRRGLRIGKKEELTIRKERRGEQQVKFEKKMGTEDFVEG